MSSSAAICRSWWSRERVAGRAGVSPWLQRASSIPTPGNMTDYADIEADLRADCERFDVQDIVIERFGALHLASNLLTSGLPARIEARTRKCLRPRRRNSKRASRRGKLRHTGSVVSDVANQSNVCVERRRDGSLLPTKDAPMRRTRSTRSMRCCWRSRRCCRRRRRRSSSRAFGCWRRDGEIHR